MSKNENKQKGKAIFRVLVINNMGNQHGTGFGKRSTTDEVARDISLVGKNVIITGANTGLGKETARIMAKMGANIIMGNSIYYSYIYQC